MLEVTTSRIPESLQVSQAVENDKNCHEQYQKLLAIIALYLITDKYNYPPKFCFPVLKGILTVQHIAVSLKTNKVFHEAC